MLTFVQSGLVEQIEKDKIYTEIHNILKEQYANETAAKIQCMYDDFRKSKVADNFYTRDLVFNLTLLRHEIDPYLKSADNKCEIAGFIQSPLGIIILSLILLVIISLLCCLIRYLCC